MAVPEPKLREIFSKAVECQSGEERAAYLDQACQGDAELRARLEGLLQARREAGSFLQEASALLSMACVGSWRDRGCRGRWHQLELLVSEGHTGPTLGSTYDRATGSCVLQPVER
jgi:hypothetical protein